MAKKQDRKPSLPPSLANLDPSLFQMVGGKKSRVKLDDLDQICIVVKDVDKAIDYYSSLFGWGPFFVIEPPDNEAIYKGELCRDRLKIAFALSGQIEIEFIQVKEGKTPHSDFLKEKGEGLHHLRFRVDDLEGTLAELAKDGIMQIWRRPKGHAVYLNNEKMAGVTIELIQKR
jgi:methylmalonyl-CoA/ethylmalonyl-CoA epimerase